MITSLLLDVLQIGVIYLVRNCSLSHVLFKTDIEHVREHVGSRRN